MLARRFPPAAVGSIISPQGLDKPGRGYCQLRGIVCLKNNKVGFLVNASCKQFVAFIILSHSFLAVSHISQTTGFFLTHTKQLEDLQSALADLVQLRKVVANIVSGSEFRNSIHPSVV